VVVAADNRREDGANDFIPSLPPLAGGPVDLPTLSAYVLDGGPASVNFSYDGYGGIAGSFEGGLLVANFGDRSAQLDLLIIEPNTGPFLGREMIVINDNVVTFLSNGTFSPFSVDVVLGGDPPPVCDPCSGTVTGQFLSNFDKAQFTFNLNLSGIGSGAAASGDVTLDFIGAYGGYGGYGGGSF
jgi:hypothetical protein